MTTSDFIAALRQARESTFGSGCAASDIKKAQDDLGVIFPTSYAMFLREFGWAKIMHNNLYGLGEGVPPYLELVKMTKEEREEMEPSIPPKLVPVMNDGAGNHYCLDTAKMVNAECPVVFWDHEHELGDKQTPEVVAPDFATWLVREIKEWEEV